MTGARRAPKCRRWSMRSRAASTSLSKSHHLPKGVTKDALAAAKSGLDSMKSTWSDASSAADLRGLHHRHEQGAGGEGQGHGDHGVARDEVGADWVSAGRLEAATGGEAAGEIVGVRGHDLDVGPLAGCAVLPACCDAAPPRRSRRIRGAACLGARRRSPSSTSTRSRAADARLQPPRADGGRALHEARVALLLELRRHVVRRGHWPPRPRPGST